MARDTCVYKPEDSAREVTYSYLDVKPTINVTIRWVSDGCDWTIATGLLCMRGAYMTAC